MPRDPGSGRPTRRLLLVLLLVDLLIVGGAVLAWQLTRDAERAGSKPPSGQQVPDVSGLALEPAALTPRALRGRVTAVAVTCVACRSGDIFGGFLTRLAAEDVPGDARVVALTWGDDVRGWQREWDIPERVRVSHASSEGAERALRREFRVGDSGVLFVYDEQGRWVSTFHAGQLRLEDVRHDLGAAASGDLSDDLGG